MFLARQQKNVHMIYVYRSTKATIGSCQRLFVYFIQSNFIAQLFFSLEYVAIMYAFSSFIQGDSQRSRFMYSLWK